MTKKNKVNKKKAKLDASDYRMIEEMKKHDMFGRKTVVLAKPSIESSAVWLATKLDSPICDELPMFDRVMYWYNFLKDNLSEEFND